MTSIITQFAHLKIPLEDILKATKNFANKNIIGKGGFGNVYRGKLNHNGELIKIAARRLDPKGTQGEVEFWTEISVLSGLDHENVVSMIGFCDELGEKIIINHHYAKGSLLTYLSKPTFTWHDRWFVAYGVVLAIHYIHNMVGRSYYIIHRNINSSTILLDDKLTPKLSGFEFSIKHSEDRKNHVILSEPISIKGYMDPAIEKNGGVTLESDIYSLGVLLFEIFCGRNANEDGRLLGPLAKCHYEKETLKDIIHHNLWNQMDPKLFKFFSDNVAQVAYSCLNEDYTLRPSAIQVSYQLLYARKLVLEDKYDDFTEDEEEKEDEEKEVDFEVNRELLDLPKVGKLEHLRIKLRDIELATNNFSRASAIKYECHYTLYKAELKCFDREYLSLVKGKNKDELPTRHYDVNIKHIKSIYHDFIKELESLSRINHHNIESLLGFCEEGSTTILVSEYVSNKYLDSCLDDRKLTWEKRLNICLDVAHGVNYLHNEIDDQMMVIHTDISSHKIVLDDYWRAKIVGFELSELLPPYQDDDALLLHKPKYVVTNPHMDPEYAKTGKLKRESDVFSFGIVMLEILCGSSASMLMARKHRDEVLGKLARQWFNQGIIKKKIALAIMEENSENNFFLHKGPNDDSLETFMNITYWCLAEKQNQRPRIKTVIKELGKAIAFHENSRDAFKMSFEDIKTATKDFRNEIGGGGFGRVYKGEVAQGQDNRHHTIVAKKLDTSHGQGEKQYYTELEILYVYKHENIIGLVGYSKETNEKIIVYEHAARGSLDKHVKSASLTWENRLKICIDVATGLEFLHGGVGGQVVIHRDIKAANILLFDDWKAKLGDFGLSLISAIDKETDYVIDHPCGTESYVDPMYLKSGFLTLESDIYSFGVVLFEILYGKEAYTIPRPKSVSLLSFIKQNFEERKKDEMVFTAIKDEIVPKSLTTFLNIIYKCLDDDREKRPTSKQVLRQLKRALKFQDKDADENEEIVMMMRRMTDVEVGMKMKRMTEEEMGMMMKRMKDEEMGMMMKSITDVEMGMMMMMRMTNEEMGILVKRMTNVDMGMMMKRMMTMRYEDDDHEEMKMKIKMVQEKTDEEMGFMMMRKTDEVMGKMVKKMIDVEMGMRRRRMIDVEIGRGMANEEMGMRRGMTDAELRMIRRDMTDMQMRMIMSEMTDDMGMMKRGMTDVEIRMLMKEITDEEMGMIVRRMMTITDEDDEDEKMKMMRDMKIPQV